LYGLKSVVENFGECLDVILDRIEPDESDAASVDEARATTELYGLIHARYIVTSHGLDAMHAKYLRRDFGTCPRYYCDNYPVLPVGLCVFDLKNSDFSCRNDSVGVAPANVYCPRCRQVFRSQACGSRVDGAYFGTTFPHLFLMTFGFPRAIPEETTSYVPRVFGFRLHRSAYLRGGGNGGATSSERGNFADVSVVSSGLHQQQWDRTSRKRPRDERRPLLQTRARGAATTGSEDPDRFDQAPRHVLVPDSTSRNNRGQQHIPRFIDRTRIPEDDDDL